MCQYEAVFPSPLPSPVSSPLPSPFSKTLPSVTNFVTRAAFNTKEKIKSSLIATFDADINFKEYARIKRV